MQQWRESVFDDKLAEIIKDLAVHAECELLVGVAFEHDAAGAALLLSELDKQLAAWPGHQPLLVALGRPGAEAEATRLRAALERISCSLLVYVLPPEAGGWGAAVQLWLAAADHLDADLLMFRPGCAGAVDLERLLPPMWGPYEMVLAHSGGRALTAAVENCWLIPLLESFYGRRVDHPLADQWALSHDFAAELAAEARFWRRHITGYGIGFWLLSRALVWNRRVAEFNIGAAGGREASWAELEELALSLAEGVRRDSALWMEERLSIAAVERLANSAEREDWAPDDALKFAPAHFRAGRAALGRHLPAALDEELRRRVEQGALPDEEMWARGLMALLLDYGFEAEDKQPEVAAAIVTLLAGYLSDAALVNADLPQRRQRRENLERAIRRRRARLAEQWQQTREQQHPPLIPLAYMEYVPGRPLTVPRQITGRDQSLINTDQVFKELRRRYEERFNQFLEEDLGISPLAPAADITAATRDWMVRLEQSLTRLLPGDLNTAAGVRELAANVLQLLPVQRMFSIREELLREVLLRFPPSNLMIPLGVKSARELLNTIDARSAFSLANLLEDSSYLDRDITWLAAQLSAESFAWMPLKLICLDREQPYGPLPRLRSSSLNRLTACLTIKALEPGWGGSYPRLKYFNSMLRRLCAAEQYSRLFYISIRGRRNIGLKVQHILLRSDHGDAFSAHNIFESFNHRLLVQKLDHIAQRLERAGQAQDARIFQRMAHSWGLSQVLENEEFLSCTPWSWASHSYKGGQGRPEAFSTSVEARCFNHDFLEALYRELGYPENEIRRTVYRLVPSGRSAESLLDHLLPSRPRDIPVLVQETTSETARPLQRYHGNPLLMPLPAHDWESRYVLNPGALRLGDEVYLFYRAVGEDGVSHIGLAITDGYRIKKRLPRPVLSPLLPEESRGCEDPRMVLIEDRVWMLYTAYDGQIAQIAAASIDRADLQGGRYTAWRREGLAFKNIWDKDAILLPERVNGRYLLIHRIEPSIWATWLDELRFPCERKHSIVMGPRPGRMWDSLKIGAGSQALKTRYGWLQIYHGVDHRHVYRLGVVLSALNAPEQVLYRSPNPVLEPIADYELGVNGAWVPNVVFSCGAVPAADKAILDDDDEILVYYGAADSSIGLATARLAELIPEKYRRA